MEEIIRLEAEKYAKNCHGLNRAKTAGIDFVAGAMYVYDKFRWRDVREEKPPIDVTVVGKKSNSWINLVKRINMSENPKVKDERYVSGNSVINWDITHWKYLE